MSNYPPGTLNDPNAPWNQPDSEDQVECQCGEPASTATGLCDHCAREEAALQRWERQRDEDHS